MTRSPKSCSAGTTAPTESTTGDAAGRTTQTTTCRSDDGTIPIPKWFLLGGFDRVPRGWKRAAMPGFPTRFVEMGEDPTYRLMVIITGAEEADGKRWIHVSMSRPGELPSYQDMCVVKEVFIGSKRKAIQVFPASDEHVNIHPYCLHLWCCIDGDDLPDFRTAGML